MKALEIACSSNIRRLNYVVGILRNWENESVLTLEEVDTYIEKKKRSTEQPEQETTDLPKEFKLDLTAGEDW